MKTDASNLPPPPTQSKIIKKWARGKQCRVSICMLTYNHSKFLKCALNSILWQDAPFGFEILVHDDASTDGTQDIIREYHSRYPQIIKPIYQSQNQYSRGGRPSVEYNYPRAGAEFVAWCEGDDYWTDRTKLRLQIAAMERHPTADLSFHPASRLDYSQTPPQTMLQGGYAKHDGIIDFLHILHRRHWGIPTAACIIRQDAFQKFFAFVKTRNYLTVGDIYHQIFGSLRGGALFLSKPMSVYRFATEHSWTRSITVDLEKKCAHEVAMIRSFAELDEITRHRYQSEFRKLVLQRIFWMFNADVPPELIEKLELGFFQELYQKSWQTIRSQAEALGQRDGNYLIFGAGSLATTISAALPEGRVLSIIDRDGEMIGSRINGIPVEDLTAIERHPECNLIIGTLSHDEPAIERLVENKRIAASQIIHFIKPMIEEIDLSTLHRACLRPLEIFQPRGVQTHAIDSAPRIQ